MYDWEDNKWVDVEKDAPDNVAVIFIGESMSRLLSSYLIPCMHDVSIGKFIDRLLYFNIIKLF